MKVDYVNHMGDDLLVVNSARVSFHKHKEEFGEDDAKLIKYLAKNNHWSPFAHPQICLRVKAPVFVARQLQKHVVGLVWNEVSRRYVDDTPEFYRPTKIRGKPTNGAKQGSGELENPFLEDPVKLSIYWGTVQAQNLYQNLIKMGVAPEQARMVLPQSMYTEWFWTGSLAAYSRICKLRLDPHAQAETQEVAQMISDIVEPLFPESWKALMT